MSDDNKALEQQVNKSLVAVDSFTTAGKMNPVQEKVFLDWVIDITNLKDQVRIVRFKPEEMKIEKIAVGERVAMPADEAKDPGMRRGITTSKVTLRPEEFIVPFEISQRATEINIEGEGLVDHIVKMMATQTANNLEELFINANKLGPAVDEFTYKGEGATDKHVRDNFLGKLDGWSLLANQGHIVNFGGLPMSADVFDQAIQAMPIKYRRGLGDMRVLISPNLWQKFKSKTGTRTGALGDSVLAGGTYKPFGLTILEVNLWPLEPLQVEHIVLNGTAETALGSINVSNVLIHPTSLAQTATASYIEDTDYTLDAATGKIARIGGGAIGDGATVKVTYNAAPQIILTHRDNLIVAFGRDITMERDREIYRRVTQFAITVACDVQVQNPDAIVKVINIGLG